MEMDAMNQFIFWTVFVGGGLVLLLVIVVILLAGWLADLRARWNQKCADAIRVDARLGRLAR
jgi:hypothetical protein